MTQKSTEAAPATQASADFLIRGSDYLAAHPGFQLVGREETLKEVSSVLMRKDGNNVLLHGMPGVGVSAVVLGLQAAKEDTNTPFDMVSKRFYWLDTDALFSSGNPTEINEGFRKTLATLARAPDTVLVIENMKDFVEGVANNGCTNIVNALMRELANGRFQAVLEARSPDVGKILAAHSELGDLFTMKEVDEPGKDQLKQILDVSIKGLEEYHGIKVSEAALASAMDLTNKYIVKELEYAQPKRALMLLEGALTEYRHSVHTCPENIRQLEAGLAALGEAEKGKASTAHAGMSKDEMAVLKVELETDLRDARADWEDRQKKLRAVYADQRKAEEEIRKIEEKIEEQGKKDAEARAKLETEAAAVPKENAGIASTTKSMLNRMGKAGIEGTEMKGLREKLGEWERLAKANREKFSELTKGINEGLELKAEHTLAEFSRLSGIPLSRLNEDETQKLLKLEETLKARVIGQNEPVEAISRAVRRGRTGLKKPNKPIGSFIFLGPSGVGKTELAKALAQALFGTEEALQSYDMTEYQEKHAVARLIGAPPGYEGYAEGGLLTNAMRKRPYCVNVFDEIEKAYKDVFDVFLQVIDEGRLTDSRGFKVSFANSVNILTSNIGSKYFLDDTITFEEAREKALKDLWDPAVGGYRPEFLNRFTGIFCFNRLGVPEIVWIAGKTFKEQNGYLAANGKEIKIAMAVEDMTAMCEDNYVPRNGARGIINYIEDRIVSTVADAVLTNPEQEGTMQVTYDRATKKPSVKFIPATKPATPAEDKVQLPVNGNVPAAAPAANAAFKPGK